MSALLKSILNDLDVDDVLYAGGWVLLVVLLRGADTPRNALPVLVGILGLMVLGGLYFFSLWLWREPATERPVADFDT